MDLTTVDRAVLIAIIAELQAVIERLQRRIAELDGQAKPDGPPRMPDLKTKPVRKPPAQQGPRKQRLHGYARRRMTPTRQVEHCPDCGVNRGRTASLAGQPNETVITDVKTGRQSPSHAVHLLPDTNGHFTKSLGTLIQRWAADAPAKKVPSAQECRFCDITLKDCPDRVEQITNPCVPATDDF